MHPEAYVHVLWAKVKKIATGHHLCLFGQVCYGPEDGTIISGGYDQAVRVWDCRSRSYDAIQTMKPYADSVTSVCITDRYTMPASSGKHIALTNDVQYWVLSWLFQQKNAILTHDSLHIW